MNKINTLVICSLLSIAVDASSLDAGSLSDKMDKMKNDQNVGQMERKRRELKDSLVIQQYEDMIRNIFKEGTLLLARRDKDDDPYSHLVAWLVRDKLLFLSKPRNGDPIRSVRVCGGDRPWKDNSSRRRGLTLETTPKIVAAGKGNVFEFKKGDYAYELDIAQNKCFYMNVNRQQVKYCKLFAIASDKGGFKYQTEGFVKSLQELRDQCDSFYWD